MGFFQELKEDLSQAVNELLPEEETGQESKKDDEDKALDDALKEVQEALAAEVGSPDTEEAGKQDEHQADGLLPQFSLPAAIPRCTHTKQIDQVPHAMVKHHADQVQPAQLVQQRTACGS